MAVQASKNSPTKPEIEADLYNRYGGMLTAKDVGNELGLKHHNSYEKWLADVPFCVVNNQKRYRCSDVAKKISQHMSV